MSIHIADSHRRTMPRQKLLHPVPGAHRGHSVACNRGLMSESDFLGDRTTPLQNSSAKNLSQVSCEIAARQHKQCVPPLGLAVSLQGLCSKVDSQGFRTGVLHPVPAQLPQSHVER